jgi:signal transduction histidine kinase
MKNTGLMDMMNKTLPTLEPLIKQNNLQVVLSTYSLPSGDASEQLSARFTNLLLNAMAYAPKSARLTISCNQTAGIIYIQVPNSDTPFSIERTVKDVQSNTFTVKTVKGEGSVYSMKI